MRIILKVPYRTNSVWMLDALKWMSIKQRVFLNTMLLIHKACIGKLPTYLRKHMKLVRNSHQINTRAAARGLYKLPNYKKSCSRNSLQFKGIRDYNNLPIDLKQCLNLKLFRSLLINYVKQNVL